MALIVGVDEAGRGPLAGPVYAGAVILNPKKRIRGLKDSKLLTEDIRESLFQEICDKALAWAFGRADVYEIDKINILQASLLAMQRAVKKLIIQPDEAWIDGNKCPQLDIPSRAIIDGDRDVKVISAASIIAKVLRDREMVELDAQFPNYGFKHHKGYGTPEHYSALDQDGPCELHRFSYFPVQYSYDKHKDKLLVTRFTVCPIIQREIIIVPEKQEKQREKLKERLAFKAEKDEKRKEKQKEKEQAQQQIVLEKAQKQLLKEKQLLKKKQPLLMKKPIKTESLKTAIV